MADLIQLCGALAVELTGGPNIPVQLGRQDASQPDSDDQLPNPDMQPAQLQQLFSTVILAQLLFAVNHMPIKFASGLAWRR